MEIDDIKDKKSSDERSTQKQVQYIRQKTEKLAGALYKVTEYINDKEPLKWSLREMAGDVTSSITGPFLGDLVSRRGMSNLRTVLGKMSSLVSLCDVARSSGSFSEMNFSILRDEYYSLRCYVESVGRATIERTIVSLRSEGRYPALTEPIKEVNSIKDKEMSDRNSLKDRVGLRTLIGEGDKMKPVKEIELKEKIERKPKITLSEANDRRSKIIDFLRKNGHSGIKDIAEIISGCSEKTIQRELASLVSENIIKKEGERRWSQYFLV